MIAWVQAVGLAWTEKRETVERRTEMDTNTRMNVINVEQCVISGQTLLPCQIFLRLPTLFFF